MEINNEVTQNECHLGCGEFGSHLAFVCFNTKYLAVFLDLS